MPNRPRPQRTDRHSQQGLPPRAQGLRSLADNYLRFIMQSVRCSRCSRLLARADFTTLEIKCPRCKHIERATSSCSKGADYVQNHAQSPADRPVDRR
ncbi:MAG: Com family DNA-binding transcriptional regulator [Pseudomonadota bacterium]|nr:Com family DNA-binding transcriptional regulator [Pseudomonadota bacterium]